MKIESRNRYVMRIGQPASFSGALPGVSASFERKFSRRGAPYTGARPVKPNSRWSSRCERQCSGAELAVHVDDQIISGGAEPRGQTGIGAAG